MATAMAPGCLDPGWGPLGMTLRRRATARRASESWGGVGDGSGADTCERPPGGLGWGILTGPFSEDLLLQEEPASHGVSFPVE
jgi:hypothetical protein